ncbi:TPA: hypothetical protein DCX15_02115 [bacterium]|nr:hypothetical protein [bacterium]
MREEILHFGMMIGESRKMQAVFGMIEAASQNEVTVLIEGETGTGKELVARAIHQNSLNSKKKFVAINCTAIPKDLIESELFGHEKGAFTSAHTRRVGKFELAEEGSILLDEIGDMEKNLQAKLLRVLEEREFSRIGGNDQIKFRGRMIATTNKPLLKLIDEGSFRNDLYYRLAEFTIHLSPLRERKEDIPPLANHFLLKESSKHNVSSISKKAMEVLTNHDWPGNIRELKNVIHRTLIQVKTSEIRPEDLRIEKRGAKEDFFLHLPPGLTLLEVEKRVILKTIQFYHGDKKAAAKALDIGISTLYEKLKQFEIENPN